MREKERQEGPAHARGFSSWNLFSLSTLFWGRFFCFCDCTTNKGFSPILSLPSILPYELNARPHIWHFTWVLGIRLVHWVFLPTEPTLWPLKTFLIYASLITAANWKSRKCACLWIARCFYFVGCFNIFHQLVWIWYQKSFLLPSLDGWCLLCPAHLAGCRVVWLLTLQVL